MQYNPKLKIAMEEIKEILHKHDIAGAIVIHTPGHSEYMTELSPSYSCAKFEGEYLRIKAKKSDYKTIEAWREVVTLTSNMLHHLSEKTADLSLQLLNASELIDKTVKAEHFGSGGTSHITQNN
jgi:hypothetical protein